jgi:hypothetical protein
MEQVNNIFTKNNYYNNNKQNKKKGEWYLYTPESQDVNNHTYSRVIMDACQGDQIKPYYMSNLQNDEEVIMCSCLGQGLLQSAYY